MDKNLCLGADVFMKELLYITKIISADNEEFYVYISTSNFKKYVFTKIGFVLIPYNDKRLLDKLNNVNGIFYDLKDKDVNKSGLTLKEKLQKTLVILGVGVIVISLYPKASDLASYSLKRLKSYSYSSVDDQITSDSGFINQFAIAINKNDDFLDEEKVLLVDGYEKYFADWGYIFDDIDKRYVLRMAENVKVNRNVSLDYPIAGNYCFDNINLVDSAPLNTVAHEACHAFSDRGLYVGSINGFGFGYAMNEGINASINDRYFSADESYDSQRYDVLKLSLLVDDEVFIKSYQQKGPLYVVKSLGEIGVNYLDAVKYISMMDIMLFANKEKYTLPEDFYVEKDELYNKMFKLKYGYDFSESLLGTMPFDNDVHFLLDKFICNRYRENDLIVGYYNFSKKDLATKECEINYSEKLIDEYFTEIMFDYNSILLLDPNFRKNFMALGSLDLYCSSIMDNEISKGELQIAKTMFSIGINEHNLKYYTLGLVNNMLAMEEWTAEFMACYLREAESLLAHNLENTFTSTVVDLLRENGREDIVDLYTKTTLHFKEVDYNFPKRNVIDEEYFKLRQTNNYIIDNNKIVLKLDVDEYSVYEGIYNGDYLFFQQVNENDCKKYDMIFDDDNGRYCYSDIYNVQGDIDTDAIKIEVCVPMDSKQINEPIRLNK